MLLSPLKELLVLLMNFESFLNLRLHIFFLHLKFILFYGKLLSEFSLILFHLRLD